jgi:hypothetical protein
MLLSILASAPGLGRVKTLPRGLSAVRQQSAGKNLVLAQ